jgi:hypothetical protein
MTDDAVEVARADLPAGLQTQMDMARALAASSLLAPNFAGKPANVFLAMQAAQALNIPAWTALQELYVVSGKVGLSASLMRSLILRAGHRIRVTVDADSQGEPMVATVTVIRRDDPDYLHHGQFSMGDAHTAGLSGEAWRKYPRAMLVARATAIVAREACPDIFASAYTPEELGGEPLAVDLDD